ncbi:hypothetical protein P6F26_06790 [Roseibacterium sp. SDUM158017]|uniref:hypothetical protein n=1 Tax=Roseicyclus salinarum TaxID=3036773 RepID=UPI0024150E30|nr:hypothetical protein [Roseibacterium sp. SDUM158017]MDG4648144.1 hypothetical protein [Roseibacterium sp. SDUM158017]
MSPTGAEAPAAPKPDIGRAAVTQAQATAKAALGAPGHAKRPVPQIPPNPPPVKGLGVPPLDMRAVGDADEARNAPPQKMSDLLGALRPPGAKGLDLRV